jgi:hypothetical protein
MLELPPFLTKQDINEVKKFIKRQNNAFGYGSVGELSHSQSPMPCRGVSLRIYQSSFMLLSIKINKHKDYKIKTNS